MDIRNIQRTGNMFYVYLPTSWCKQFGVDNKAKVQLSTDHNGNLMISPMVKEKEAKHIDLSIDETNLEVINKLIVACYINPTKSFRIKLKEKLDQQKLLEQKKLLSIELIEMESKQITCESSVMVNEPQLLLKTIINKIKNMLLVMTKNYNQELINRYEEEIDRNKVLIDKAMINVLTHTQHLKTKPVYLYYITQIAGDLERVADQLLMIDKEDDKFFTEVIAKVDVLKGLIEEGFSYKEVISFVNEILGMKKSKNVYKDQIKMYLQNVSEVLMDWAITNELGE